MRINRLGFIDAFLPLAMISLEVHNLQKTYGSKTVFSGINFRHDGGSLGIAGRNGSGKTTLLQCLSRLTKPTAGTIRWMENDTELETGELKKNLGFVAPYINLYRELSCRENMEFLSRLRNLPEEQVADSMAYWLSAVGLAEASGEPFGNLSTGQQQRLRLACGLFYNPRIVFLDEPGSNLDEKGQALIREITSDPGSSGTVLIIASNNPDELELCERIYSIESGCFIR